MCLQPERHIRHKLIRELQASIVIIVDSDLGSSVTVKTGHMAATGLTSLPTEILIAIARELWPRDLEAFVCTCRDILVASGSVLDEHRVLQRGYRHIKAGISGCEPAPPEVYHRLSSLLRTVLQEPRIAAHVEHLSLVQPWEATYKLKGDIDWAISDVLDIFTDVLNSFNISRPECDWLFEREDGVASGLLLLHLPHLETFHWSFGRMGDGLDDVLTTVLKSRLAARTEANRPRLRTLEAFDKIETPSAGLKPPLLPALKKVIIDLPEGALRAECTIYLQEIIPFLALPSIESLHITPLNSLLNKRSSVIALVPHKSSNVREVVLSHSSLGEALDHLLRLPRSLRRLSFVAPVSPGHWIPQDHWIPHEIFPLDRLRLNDLERLTIRMRRWHDHIDRQALPRIYRKLLYLETSVFLTDDATLSPVGDIKHSFPPSVQHLAFADCHFETQTDVFLYFQQILELQRARILPDLRRLTLRSEMVRLKGFEAQIQRIKQECAAQGVEFDLDFDWERSLPDSPVDESRPRSWWRRNHKRYSTTEIDKIVGHGQPDPKPPGIPDYHYCNQEI